MKVPEEKEISIVLTPYEQMIMREGIKLLIHMSGTDRRKKAFEKILNKIK